MITSKVCTICKRDLPTERFVKSRNSKFGLYARCKECHANSQRERRIIWELNGKPKTDTQDKLICTACGKEKVFADFVRDRNAIRGRHSHCKLCHNNRLKKYHAQYPEFRRRRDNARNRQVRMDVLSHYSRGKPICACCGEYRLPFLSIDHIGGGGRQHRKSIKRQSGGFYIWLKLNNFPSGFRVLCMNCNFATRLGFPCPHEMERQVVA